MNYLRGLDTLVNILAFYTRGGGVAGGVGGGGGGGGAGRQYLGLPLASSLLPCTFTFCKRGLLEKGRTCSLSGKLGRLSAVICKRGNFWTVLLLPPSIKKPTLKEIICSL